MVAHSDRVGIGKTDRQFTANRSMIFDDNIPFAPDILSRRLHVRPDAGFEQFASLLIDHAEIDSGSGVVIG